MANDTPNQSNDPKPLEPGTPEIEPLSDEALEEVAGGIIPASSNSCCSCSGCS
jgi:hypothetical protein